MFKVVPLEEAHMKAIGYDKTPTTVRGVAVLDGDKVMLVTGIYFGEACWILASKFSPEYKALLLKGRERKAMLKAGHQVLDMVRGRKLPLYAIADPDAYGSVTLLKHLGFTHYRKDAYVWAA